MKNNLVEVEECCVELEKQVVELLSVVEVCVEKLVEVIIIVGVKFGDEGKLFGFVGIVNIVDVISE